MATALSFPDAAKTIVASRSTTVTPVSSRPATRSQGNPAGRAASWLHQCRRNSTTAALSRDNCSSPASDRARHTVGAEGTGPISGASCASAWKSLIASPPAISTRARSAKSWPRSYNGLEPRRRIAAESPARSPVPSASSRNGSSPTWAASRSSSPTSSRPAAHEVPCTEEVHPPQPDRDPRQIAFLLVRCTSPLFRAFHARRVANPGERRRPATDGPRRLAYSYGSKGLLVLPRRFRSSVAGAPCGPGRLATGSLVTLAVLLAGDDLSRARRVKAKPLPGRFASLATLATARDGGHEEAGEEQGQDRASSAVGCRAISVPLASVKEGL